MAHHDGLTAVGVTDGTIELYDNQQVLLATIIGSYNRRLNALVWAPGDHPWLASAGEDARIQVTDCSKPQQHVPMCTLTGHELKVTALAWSVVDGAQRLASASHDGTVQIWAIPPGTPLFNLRGHAGPVLAVCWSGTDAEQLFSGAVDHTCRCWQLGSQTYIQPPQNVEHERKQAVKRVKQQLTAGTRPLASSTLIDGSGKVDSPIANVSTLPAPIGPEAAIRAHAKDAHKEKRRMKPLLVQCSDYKQLSAQQLLHSTQTLCNALVSSAATRPQSTATLFTCSPLYGLFGTRGDVLSTLHSEGRTTSYYSILPFPHQIPGTNHLCLCAGSAQFKAQVTQAKFSCTLCPVLFWKGLTVQCETIL